MRVLTGVSRGACLSLAVVLLPVLPFAVTGAAVDSVPPVAPPVELHLDGGVAAAALKATSAVRETEPFTMVGATWTGADPGELRVSTRTDGVWSPWRHLDPIQDGQVVDGVRGTHLLWVGAQGATAVRVLGAAAADVELVVIDSDPEGNDVIPAPGPTAEPTPEPTAEPTAVPTPETAPKKQTKKKKKKTVPRPRIRSRKSWGAYEKWREDDPVFNKRVKQIHVHHTASGNDYRKADVPGLIRGFYRYHTKSLGWSDIGYNALVDKFGRAWVGRHGGMAKRVRGAHTLGFNHASTGIAVIGNFETRAPSPRSVRTVARIAAWQLDRNGSRARGKVRVRSQGSTRFRKSRTVTLPIIDGHRHTNHTLCPGQKLFDKLPRIRRIAQRRINRF